MLERRSSERQQTCEESSSIWFYVLFYNASIAIGYDKMIGKECSFVYFSIRLLEISTVSVPYKILAKMGANGPPGSRNRNWGNIFILSVRKVVFSVSVIFVCIFPQLPLQRHSLNKCDICHIPTSRSSLNASSIAAEPHWLISRVKIVP